MKKKQRYIQRLYRITKAQDREVKRMKKHYGSESAYIRALICGETLEWLERD